MNNSCYYPVIVILCAILFHSRMFDHFYSIVQRLSNAICTFLNYYFISFENYLIMLYVLCFTVVGPLFESVDVQPDNRGRSAGRSGNGRSIGLGRRHLVKHNLI